MKIQIVSDIHLSLAPCVIPDVGADLLILAGDIHRPVEALRWAKELPIPIVYVPGNHEYYNSSLSATDRLLGELAQDSNVTMLDCAEKCIGNVRVLGAALWTDFLLYGDGPEREKAMEEARRFSRDFSRITVDDEGLELLTPIHCATLFKRHASWLEARLAEPFDGATVVVTHFAPSAGSVAPRYAGSPLNACFVSNLDALVEKSGAALWVHGHTHDSFDYHIKGTRVLANPRGYVKNGKAENPAFDPGLTIDVGCVRQGHAMPPTGVI
ncbi:MAG: metallophosphoesterase [Rhodocyclaceae bacterium]|nr:metallophosphoesterase [Rhodocyclaceae bacterium]